MYITVSRNVYILPKRRKLDSSKKRKHCLWKVIVIENKIKYCSQIYHLSHSIFIWETIPRAKTRWSIERFARQQSDETTSDDEDKGQRWWRERAGKSFSRRRYRKRDSVEIVFLVLPAAPIVRRNNLQSSCRSPLHRCLSSSSLPSSLPPAMSISGVVFQRLFLGPVILTRTR